MTIISFRGDGKPEPNKEFAIARKHLIPMRRGRAMAHTGARVLTRHHNLRQEHVGLRGPVRRSISLFSKVEF